MNRYTVKLPGRCIKTLVVEAKTGKDALAKVNGDGEGVEGVDVHFYWQGRARNARLQERNIHFDALAKGE
jgi:hypothetical protein